MVRAKNRSEFAVTCGFVLGASGSQLTSRLFQKAMLKRTPFYNRKLQVHVAVARDIGGSRPDDGSPTAGIGTELLARREKIEGMRRSSTFERSPVPMSRANRRAHAHFAHFPGECLKPETGWRRELDSNSRTTLTDGQ